MYDEEFDPARAERLIVSLRIENRQLKARIRAADRLSALELPAKWQKKFAEIRRQNAKYRTERNEARADLAALRAERV
ncbi:hypothetical protein H7J06_05450 [Mycobacterium hodleri]|uniref:hypothetical protein n=1 Tax=Mycolicibacterium hodleri TaxID=49897 RepID=UPI0021F2EE09|nr:hypothetical protein [Mycolicibacterium hodleri]MCV7132424.1 hypothetical protein [Mycolicibacterium hodleri]